MRSRTSGRQVTRANRGRLGQLIEALESRVLLSTVVTTGPATQLVFLGDPPSGLTTGKLSKMQVAIEDADGNIVRNYRSSISITVDTGETLSGKTTVNVKKGVATFKNMSLATAGTFQLDAAADGLAGASSPLVISAKATKLQILSMTPTTSSTGSLRAGQTFTVDVQLQDAHGNPALGDNSPLKLTLIPNGKKEHGATLYGTTLQSADANTGIAEYTVSVTRVGNYQLQAVEGHLKSNVSTSFPIVVGPAAALKIESIKKGNAGGIRALGGLSVVTVGVTDAYGNVVTTNDSTVTLTLFSTLNNQTTLGTGVQEGSPFTADAIDGIATFNSFTLLPHGWHHLVATETGLVGDDAFIFVAFTT